MDKSLIIHSEIYKQKTYLRIQYSIILAKNNACNYFILQLIMQKDIDNNRMISQAQELKLEIGTGLKKRTFQKLKPSE